MFNSLFFSTYVSSSIFLLPCNFFVLRIFNSGPTVKRTFALYPRGNLVDLIVESVLVYNTNCRAIPVSTSPIQIRNYFPIKKIRFFVDVTNTSVKFLVTL